MLEFCEAAGELPGGIDEGIVFPSPVLEVVTSAHKYAVTAEGLGFRCLTTESVQKEHTKV